MVDEMGAMPQGVGSPIYGPDGTLVGTCPAGYSCTPMGSGTSQMMPMGMSIGTMPMNGCCGMQPSTSFYQPTQPMAFPTNPGFSTGPAIIPNTPSIMPESFSGPSLIGPSVGPSVGPVVPNPGNGIVDNFSGGDMGALLPTVTSTPTSFRSTGGFGGGASFAPAPSFAPSFAPSYAAPSCPPRRMMIQRPGCLQKLFNGGCRLRNRGCGGCR